MLPETISNRIQKARPKYANLHGMKTARCFYHTETVSLANRKFRFRAKCVASHIAPEAFIIVERRSEVHMILVAHKVARGALCKTNVQVLEDFTR